MFFLRTDPGDRRRCEEIVEQVVREEGQELLGWRTVPTDNAPLGPTARAAQPVIRQVFIGLRAQGLHPLGLDDLVFERKLYVIRKRVESAVKASDVAQRGMFYVPSL